MKIHIAALLACFALTGCAHVRLQSWEGNKFTLCGNQMAGDEDFQKVADKRCGKPSRMIGGAVVNSGDFVRTQFGVQAVRKNCITYSCE